MVVGRLLSYWEGNFSGAMLNFGRVWIFFLTLFFPYIDPIKKSTIHVVKYPLRVAPSNSGKWGVFLGIPEPNQKMSESILVVTGILGQGHTTP